MKKKSVTITAAWIGGACILIAAFITGVFGLFKPPGTVTQVTTGDQHEGPLMVMGQSRDITINYNVHETITNTAVKALETKLEGASKNITLNRQEIELLDETDEEEVEREREDNAKLLEEAFNSIK